MLNIPQSQMTLLKERTEEPVTTENTTNPVFLSEHQKQILEHWVCCGTSPQRLAFRCRILFLRAEGKGIKAVMRALQS